MLERLCAGRREQVPESVKVTLQPIIAHCAKQAGRAVKGEDAD